MHPSEVAIRCMGVLSDEESPFPVFLGRDDGIVEKYVSIRDVDLGIPSLTLRGHRKAVTALLAVSPDELLSCSLDGTLREWNADGMLAKSAARLTRRIDLVVPLYCMARQGERLYLGGGDGSLHIVNGVRRSTWEGHRDVLACIAFAEEGNLVVTGGYDHQILVWDATGGKPIRRLLGHSNRVIGIGVVAHPEFASGDEDEEGAARGRDRPRPRLDGAIVSFSKDRTMKVWLLPSPHEEFGEEVAGLLDKGSSGTQNGASFPSVNLNANEAKPPSLSTSKTDAPAEAVEGGGRPRRPRSTPAIPSASTTPCRIPKTAASGSPSSAPPANSTRRASCRKS
ncbi:unnamed protein product [Phytomonas sp. Hart1]|nr:unnamed protein product [Phytomonas sp. Hart1]|eukprot:CCW70738.1 unnamed protein product [Phytomonas sp. isolate Hart1]